MAKLAVEHGIKVVPIPGANAALTALVASGMVSTPFFFGGFLPKTKHNRSLQLAAWKNIPATMILYEAPHRIKIVVKEILAAWGDRQLTLGRELTKVHEEFWRGTLAQAADHFEAEPPRGEFVLIIAQGAEQPHHPTITDPLGEVRRLMAEGVPKKEALSRIAKASGLPRRELYNKLLAMPQQ